MRYPKVVIIGGGFGGLTAALHLKKGPSEVRIIDKTNHHLFQPLLYQVASAVLSPNDIARPIREILNRNKNAVVIMGEVVKIDREARRVHMENGDSYSFDVLILAPGARHSYFGNPAWEALAPGLKNLHDARSVRDKILRSFEMAERSDSLSASERYLNFVVVGGGPTGVEVAGAVAEIAYQVMLKDFHHIRPEKAKVYLLEGGERLLASFSPELSEQAKKDLESLGVKVMLQTMVVDIRENEVELKSGEIIQCRNVVWAAGNEASPLLKTLGTPLDRQGRAIVGPDMSIPDDPWIFVLGDAAHYKDEAGNPLPSVAPVAAQQAKYVARLIRKELPPDKRKPFVYFDKGQMATIGRSRAVLEVGTLKMRGFLAWMAWGLVHIMFLISFRNKFRVMFEWALNYLMGRRGSRLIYNPLDAPVPSEQDASTAEKTKKATN